MPIDPVAVAAGIDPASKTAVTALLAGRTPKENAGIKSAILKRVLDAVSVGGKPPTLTRGRFTLQFEQPPELQIDKLGNIIGIDCRVRLFDGATEVPIDGHRRFFNPPLQVATGGLADRVVTHNPIAAFIQILWDSIQSTPAPEGWNKPGTVDTYYAGIADNFIIAGGATYAIARAGTGSVAVQTVSGTTSIYVGSQSGNNIFQSYFGWDTSPIPDTDAVTAATINLYMQDDQSVTDFGIQARISNWGPTVVAGSYIAGANLAALTLVGTLATSGIGAVGYKALVDAGAGLATQVNLTGTTYIILNGDREVNNTGSPPGNAHVGFAPADTAGTTQDPQLVITHFITVVKSTTMKWATQLPVTLSLTMKWATQLPVTTSLVAVWGVAAPMSVSYTMKWATALPVTLSLTMKWATQLPVTTSLVAKWGIAAPMVVSYTLKWATSLPVTTSLTMKWATQLPVTTSLVAKWATQQVVPVSTTMRWVSGGGVTQSLTFQWNVLFQLHAIATATLLWQVLPGATRVDTALKGQYRPVVYTFVYERVTSMGVYLEDVTAEVLSADFDVNNDRAIVRGANFTFVPGVTDINFVADFIRASMKVLVDGAIWETIVIGTYTLNLPQTTYRSTHKEQMVSAAGMAALLEQTGPTTSYTVPAGTNVVTRVRAIVASLGLQSSFVNSTKVTASDLTWIAGVATWLDVVNELLHGIDYYSCWDNRWGVITSRPTDDLYNKTPDVVYDDSSMILSDDIAETVNTVLPANQVIMTATDPARVAITSVRTNADPNSPISTVSLGRVIQSRVAANTAVDQTTLDAMAARYLRDQQNNYILSAIATPLDPRRGAREVYRVTVADAGYTGTLWRQRGWKFNAEVGAKMVHDISRTMPVQVT